MPQLELPALPASVFYLDEGAGQPTLFLHGNPDSAEVWRAVFAGLPGPRCLAPDLPGFGRTAVRADYPYTLDHMADFSIALLDRLGIAAPVDLVVHDAGGLFGLATAAKYPARIRRLVALNTIFFADYRYHFWARVCRLPLLGELGMALLNRPLYAWQMRRCSPQMPQSYIDESYRRITPAMQRHVLRMYRALGPQRFIAWEPRLRAATAKIPTLVLWGDHDPYIPQHYADRLGGTVRHFPCGHWLQLEQPAAITQALREFLTAP